jgi:hypothetical protein
MVVASFSYWFVLLILFVFAILILKKFGLRGFGILFVGLAMGWLLHALNGGPINPFENFNSGVSIHSQ